MALLTPSLKDIYAPVESELRDVSALWKKELGSDDPLIRRMHDHILGMSGKFLRPALTLLSAKLGPRGAGEKPIALSVAIELIHTATLVHDDIIDDSSLRRNQPTVQAKFGPNLSIVAGDYLYAKAFVLLARLKDVWLSEVFATCAHVMCEGEMKQIERRTDFGMSEEQFMKIIHKKTAALFQAACMGGGYLAGLDPAAIERAGDYGYRLGMAFQIVDDCLDLTGETESLGKKAGLDVCQNDVTLPLLYLFQDLPATERARYLAALTGRSGGDDVAEEIKRGAIECGAVGRAMTRARAFGDEALACLDSFPASPVRESLQQLVRHCLERVR